MRTLIAIALLLVATVAAAQPPDAATLQNVVVTSGEAVVRQAPDRAFVTVSVEARARSPRDAQRQNAEAMTAVQQRLAAARVAKESIRTLGYDLEQEFDFVQGRRIQRLGPNHYAVDGISFTPCDCKAEEPSWRIQADRADVEVGERVTLAWPVVYVHGVPVLPLPWAYLPLSDRRTGFLVPRIDTTYLTGLALQEPLFITLGQSADLTLTPGWFLGGAGVRGPRLLTELRYAPSEGTAGHESPGISTGGIIPAPWPEVPSRSLSLVGHATTSRNQTR